MQFKFVHNNFNVYDLDKSLEFYQTALNLKEVHRIHGPNGSFILVFLGDEISGHQLELTWLKDRTEKYNLGDNEFHLALTVDDFEKAKAYHASMGCICYENKEMGLYFISDPDGYWIEILPSNR